jgi:hypothetical protein
MLNRAFIQSCESISIQQAYWTTKIKETFIIVKGHSRRLYFKEALYQISGSNTGAIYPVKYIEEYEVVILYRGPSSGPSQQISREISFPIPLELPQFPARLPLASFTASDYYQHAASWLEASSL